MNKPEVDLSSAVFTEVFEFEIKTRRNKNCCDLRLFIPENQQPQVVLLTEISENKGQSITNAIQYLIPQALEYLATKSDQFEPNNCVVVEHYNRNSYRSADNYSESFDLVKPLAPMWSSISPDQFKLLIQGKFDFKIKPYEEFLAENWNR